MCADTNVSSLQTKTRYHGKEKNRTEIGIMSEVDRKRGETALI